MQPKLLSKTLATYTPAAWTGKNESGIFPIGDRVLVLADEAAERTAGGIEIPQEVTYRMTLAAEAGVVVEIGDGAFKWNSDKVTPFAGRLPTPGVRVCIEKYSGQTIKGDDGKMYRLMESACIGAILTEQKNG